MNLLNYFTILFVILQTTNGQDKEKDKDNADKLRGQFFQKMLIRRREEHLILQKNLLSFKYEQQFNLMEIAIAKLFELIDENRNKLQTEEIKKKPAEQQMAESIILENVCLLSDFVLNFNKITYDVFKRLKFDAVEKFREALEWTKKYNAYFDKITEKELKFVSDNIEKIRNQEPLENPFENNLAKMFAESEDNPNKTTPKPKKKKKSLKKGPSLTNFGEL